MKNNEKTYIVFVLFFLTDPLVTKLFSFFNSYIGGYEKILHTADHSPV